MASTGTQLEPCFAQRGWPKDSYTKVPFGSAKVCDVAVRRDVTSTGLPEECANSNAADTVTPAADAGEGGSAIAPPQAAAATTNPVTTYGSEPRPTRHQGFIPDPQHVRGAHRNMGNDGATLAADNANRECAATPNTRTPSSTTTYPGPVLKTAVSVIPTYRASRKRQATLREQLAPKRSLILARPMRGFQCQATHVQKHRTTHGDALDRPTPVAQAHAAASECSA